MTLYLYFKTSVVIILYEFLSARLNSVKYAEQWLYTEFRSFPSSVITRVLKKRHSRLLLFNREPRCGDPLMGLLRGPNTSDGRYRGICKSNVF